MRWWHAWVVGVGRLVSDVVLRAVAVVAVVISTAFCLAALRTAEDPSPPGPRRRGWPAGPWSRGRSDPRVGRAGQRDRALLVAADGACWPCWSGSSGPALRSASSSCGCPVVSFLVQVLLPAVGWWAGLPSTGWSVVLWTVFASRSWGLNASGASAPVPLRRQLLDGRVDGWGLLTWLPGLGIEPGFLGS